MKIILIILAIIGLLKIVSLFICLYIEIYYKIKDIYISGVRRTIGFYKHFKEFYIIPSIKVCYENMYFEIIVNFLWFELYSCYSIDKE